jgi:hypothetical protein
MTDNSPEQLPTPGSPPPPDPEPAPAPGTSGRYAVYDKTLLRFVGPVTDKRPTKAAVKDLVGDHDHEVREV